MIIDDIEKFAERVEGDIFFDYEIKKFGCVEKFIQFLKMVMSKKQMR